ncbi:MAG: hypothetical protein M3203_03535 [Actinomycetota bacterium]|nr:hypothetical protein [Actinomycetota bacterium]
MAVNSSPPPPGWLLEAADRLRALADAIRSPALGQLVEDVQSSLRRRPHLFLVATMAAGCLLRIAWGEGEVEEREQDGRGKDELDSGALDALLLRMWPG